MKEHRTLEDAASPAEVASFTSNWDSRKAALLMIVLAVVVVSFALGVAAVVDWVNTPAVPDECFDTASHERTFAQCEHLDHRMHVEGEYAICSCTRSDDG